jgi:hypothetical protein
VVARLLPELQRIGQLPDVVDRIRLIGGQVVTSPRRCFRRGCEPTSLSGVTWRRGEYPD